MKRFPITVLMVTLAAGCATAPRMGGGDSVVVAGGLIVDGKGKDRNRILQDGNECTAIAQETNPEGRAAAGAAAGAIFGALVGALVFRGSGLSGNRGAGYGAGLGALSGAGGGAAAGAQDMQTVMRNCMAGRGHVPLN